MCSLLLQTQDFFFWPSEPELSLLISLSQKKNLSMNSGSIIKNMDELPCVCWELSLGLLQEQQVLIITKPSYYLYLRLFMTSQEPIFWLLPQTFINKLMYTRQNFIFVEFVIKKASVVFFTELILNVYVIEDLVRRQKWAYLI